MSCGMSRPTASTFRGTPPTTTDSESIPVPTFTARCSSAPQKLQATPPLAAAKGRIKANPFTILMHAHEREMHAHINPELSGFCCSFLGSVHGCMQRFRAHHHRAHSTLLRDVHDLALRGTNQHCDSVMTWRDSHHHIERLNLQPTGIVDHM